jgi:hypothetical protein
MAGVEDIVKDISRDDIDKTIEFLYDAWKNDKASLRSRSYEPEFAM